MNDEDHEQISRLAHELWEKEGRPEGRDAEHWQTAKRMAETGETSDGAEMTRSGELAGDEADAPPSLAGASIPV